GVGLGRRASGYGRDGPTALHRTDYFISGRGEAGLDRVTAPVAGGAIAVTDVRGGALAAMVHDAQWNRRQGTVIFTRNHRVWLADRAAVACARRALAGRGDGDGP